jgi:hypothetical protein
MEPAILSKNYTTTDKGEVIIVQTGKKMKPFLSGAGYQAVKLWDGKKTHHRYVHRLVAMQYCQGMLPSTEVNHIDGNKLNNRASNLEWVTKSANMKHAYAIGLNKPSPQPGSKHGNSKLIEKDISDIRELHKGGLSLGKIAKQYPVTKATIWKICTGMSWGHVNV